MQNQNDSLLGILVLLYKWRKQIIIATLLAAIVTAGVSLTLPNYYQSQTVFYAASPDLVKSLRSEDKRIYGSDSDMDRLLSIAQSNEVRSFLIDSFDLYDHYDIDRNDPKASHKIQQKLDKLYSTSKTRYDAISLVVEDKDPDFSANMANGARDKIEATAQALIKRSQWSLIEGLRKNIEKKSNEYKALTDSLYNLRERHKIFNTVSQGEAFGTAMVELNGKVENLNAQVIHLKNISGSQDSIMRLQAKLQGARKELATLNSDIKSYNEGYPAVVNIERERKDFGSQLGFDKETLTQYEAVYNSDINAIHVVQEAVAPVVKSRPRRSILVIGITMLVFVLASLWVIVQDQFNKNNWRAQFKDA
ncbi:MAG: hypothetical protein HKN09_08100 [Saprospiraceae bacterium]|nr:hypothetical protein [Saprospiraceae bacterium]